MENALKKGAQPDTATKTQEQPTGTDREPSSARSASDPEAGVDLARVSDRVGGCREPRTARGPMVVRPLYPPWLTHYLSRCALERGATDNW